MIAVAWLLGMVLAAQEAHQASPASPGAREPVGTGATSPAGADSGASPPPAAAPAPSSLAGAENSITHYPASFFASFQASTALDLIGRLPGFVFDGGASVRGFAGAAGNVLIDGARPTSKTDSLQAILSRIPASSVDHIDVIHGGASGIDMQGKTLLANVIRKQVSSTVISVQDRAVLSDGRQVPAVFATTTQHLGTKLLEGSLQVGRLLDTSAGDGPETRRDAQDTIIDRLRDDTDADGVRVVATGAVTTPSFGGTLRLNGRAFVNRYLSSETDQDLVDPTAQASVEHDSDLMKTGELSLTYDRSIGRKLSITALVSQQLMSDDSRTAFNAVDDIENYEERHQNGETIARLSGIYVVDPSLTLEAGAEGDLNWLRSRTNYVVNAVPQDVPAGRVKVEEDRGEAFAKATWTISKHVGVELGARLEASRITSSGDVVLGKTLVYPKPRAVLTWSPDPADQLRVRIEREVSQLDFKDFVSSASLITGQVFTGNPNLVPQQSLAAEAAYERHFLGSGDATITYRHSELTDVIDRAPVLAPSGAFDAPANIGGGREDEVIAGVSLPLDRFGVRDALLKANATFRSSSVTDPTTETRRRISAVRPSEGKIDFSKDIERWKLTWGGSFDLGYVSPYYRYSQVEVDRVEPSGSFFVEYKPEPSLDIRGELDNIGNDWARNLEVYPDLRTRSALSYGSRRDLRLGPVLLLRVRKTV